MKKSASQKDANLRRVKTIFIIFLIVPVFIFVYYILVNQAAKSKIDHNHISAPKQFVSAGTPVQLSSGTYQAGAVNIPVKSKPTLSNGVNTMLADPGQAFFVFPVTVPKDIDGNKLDHWQVIDNLGATYSPLNVSRNFTPWPLDIKYPVDRNIAKQIVFRIKNNVKDIYLKVSVKGQDAVWHFRLNQ